jgi:hypothetical protein
VKRISLFVLVLLFLSGNLHALLTRKFAILGVSDVGGNYPQIKKPILAMMYKAVARVTSVSVLTKNYYLR